MGIKILKIVSAIVIVFLLIAVFSMAWFASAERKHLIDPYIDTQFAPDYTPEKFEGIKMGMTINEVETIVGKPFHTNNPPVFYHIADDSTKIEYVYTGDGKLLHKMQEQGKRYYYDCAWYYSSVVVDTNNIVVEINKVWCYD
ncbi:MAG: hypothetical protein FWC39_01515 [Bacteroidetes bacterium]|nr:hypothetical protein [Bacteroidota bacterium]